jgi:hypothetical protein
MEKADAQAKELAPIIVEIRANGVTTLQAIANKLNARGIPTARGDKWGTSSVFRLHAHRQAQRHRISTQTDLSVTADAGTSARKRNRAGRSGENAPPREEANSSI